MGKITSWFRRKLGIAPPNRLCAACRFFELAEDRPMPHRDRGRCAHRLFFISAYDYACPCFQTRPRDAVRKGLP